jgi:hypothetical protein
MSHSYLCAARKSLTPIKRPPQLTRINSATGSADLESPHERVAACYHLGSQEFTQITLSQWERDNPGVRH